MKKQFNPSRVIRLLSPDAFADLAEAMGGDRETARREHRIYLRKVDGAVLRQMLARLQEVDDLVAGDGKGLAVAVEESATAGIELDFGGYESVQDRAAALLLRHPDLARRALLLARAADLEATRYWVTRAGMPDTAVDFSSDAREELQHAVGGFYRAKEGRGDYQHLEHLVRADGSHYFFLLLSDYTQRADDFDDAGQLTPRSTRPGFEVVYAYHPDVRTLHTYARGGAKYIGPLQEMFASAILHGQPLAEHVGRQPYQLNGLLRRDFAFPTDPEDGVRMVQVKAAKVRVIGGDREGKEKMGFQTDENDTPHALHEMLDRYLNQQNLPLSRLHVTNAQLGFLFNERGPGRSMTVDIGSRTCTLKNKTRHAWALCAADQVDRDALPPSGVVFTMGHVPPGTLPPAILAIPVEEALYWDGGVKVDGAVCEAAVGDGEDGSPKTVRTKTGKRSAMITLIGRLTKILQDHIITQREIGNQSLREGTRWKLPLPPTQRELARLAETSLTSVHRAMTDPEATMLVYLAKIAQDEEAVLTYRGKHL